MPKTALIVDDSATMRDMVSGSLEAAGFETLAARDGQQALDLLDGTSVDLIISDLNMPLMDGFTFIRQARSRTALKGVPILVLTTESQADLKAQGKAAGATGWLIKPFNPEMLLRVVAKVVP